MEKYRKKPVVIEAVQYPCEHPALRRCDCASRGDCACSMCGHEFIETLEGRMRVSPGDWIIRGVQGEHYPCKPDIFAATYEPADAAPQPPAEAQAQGGGETDPMLTVAARNLRSYLSKASFSSAVDKRAAENCVEVLVAAATAPPSAPVGVGALLREYRPSMDADVLHSWAKDAVAALAQQPAAVTQPGAGEVSNGSGQPAAVDGAAIRYALEHARDLDDGVLRVLAAITQQPSVAPSGPAFDVIRKAVEDASPRWGEEHDNPMLHKLSLREREWIAGRVFQALAQQPVGVDGAMVQAALDAYAEHAEREGFDSITPEMEAYRRRWMVAALTAALAAQPGGSDNDR